MKGLFLSIDSLLRGKRTTELALRDSAANLSVRTFAPAGIVLGAIFGLCMASYSLANRTFSESSQQALAAMVKLPALFLITLVISFPSLYVFNVLIGCRLGMRASLRLLVSAIVVNLAVAASLGPIVAFFAVSTQSYPFMVLLNVFMLALGGAIGLSFLARSLRTLAQQAASDEFDAMTATEQAGRSHDAIAAMHAAKDGAGAMFSSGFADPGAPPSPSDEPIDPKADARIDFIRRESFLRERTSSANLIFWIWVLLYAAVGGQTGWLLRPFIGHPNGPVEWFRPRSGNFFMGVLETLGRLVGN